MNKKNVFIYGIISLLLIYSVMALKVISPYPIEGQGGSSSSNISVNLSGYVPYTGATGNLDLGIFNAYANAFYGSGAYLTNVNCSTISENDTLQSVTTRGNSTNRPVEFRNVSYFYDDVFIIPKTSYTLECFGEPSSDCSQYETEENCDLYNYHSSECSWSNGSTCSEFSQYDCENTQGCTPSYVQNECYDYYFTEYDCDNAGNTCYSAYNTYYCEDLSYDEGSCSLYSPPCTAHYSDYCDVYDNTDYSTCEGMGGCTWSDPDCMGLYYFSSCSGGVYYDEWAYCAGTFNGDFDSCSGTYGLGCSGTLTCSAQTTQGEEGCEYIDGCTYDQVGRNATSNLDIAYGNATIKNNLTVGDMARINKLCVGGVCTTSGYETEIKGDIWTTGSGCYGASSTTECSDTNWVQTFIGGSNAYGYSAAFQSKTSNRVQMKTVASGNSAGLVFGYYDTYGFIQVYKGSTAEQELKFQGGTGQDTVTIKIKNANISNQMTSVYAVSQYGNFSKGIRVTNITADNSLSVYVNNSLKMTIDGQGNYYLTGFINTTKNITSSGYAIGSKIGITKSILINESTKQCWLNFTAGLLTESNC